MADNYRFNGPGQVWSGDSGYHGRHKRRSLKRAQTIASHIGYSRKFLDVGCNQGLTTSYLLNIGKIGQATGVEIAEDAVSQDLLSRKNFRLLTGDVCDIEIDDIFDCVFYGAVHHHIVRERGLGAAIEVFKKVVKSCDGVLFFETGQLTEGGRWLWQKELNRYFSSDEEHIYYLLRSIEKSLVDFHVIGRFQIHGVRRYLYKIYIDNKRVEDSPSRNEVDFEELILKKSFSRTFGSSEQQLEESQDLISDTGVKLAEAQLGEERIFLKTRFRSPHIDLQEYELGSQMNFEWAVRPRQITDQGIIFPWIDGDKIGGIEFDAKIDRKKLISQLDRIRLDISNKDIELSPSLFCPHLRGKAIDIFDFNVNNFLVTKDSGELRVVDFEFHSTSACSRNLLNFAKLYCLLGSYRVGLKLYLKGSLLEVGKLLSSQLLSFRGRVILRRPALFSVLGTILRSKIGKLVVKVFPFLAER